MLHLADAAEHFAVHQAEADTLGTTFTLLDFVMDHYLDPNNHQHEQGNEHDELPFTHTHSHSLDWAEINILPSCISQAEEKLSSQSFITLLSFYSSDFTSGLDQPPNII